MINKQAFLIGYKQAQQDLYKQAAREDDEEDEGWDWKDYAMAGAGGLAGGVGLGAAGLGLYNYLGGGKPNVSLEELSDSAIQGDIDRLNEELKIYKDFYKQSPRYKEDNKAIAEAVEKDRLLNAARRDAKKKTKSH
jgi:hypothetical protein